MYIQVVSRLLLWAQDWPGAASLEEKQLESNTQRGSEGPLKDTEASAEWLQPCYHRVDGRPPSNVNIWGAARVLCTVLGANPGAVLPS